VFKLVDEFVRVAFGIFVAGIGKIYLPEDSIAHVCASGLRMELNAQKVARKQGVNVLKACHRSRKREERKNMINYARIWPRFDQAGRKQRFNLGGEEEPVPFSLMRQCPVKRTDPKPISGESQPLASLIPDSQGKLAPQPLQAIFLILLPKMGNQFRITVG